MGALAALLVSALDGPSFRFPQARQERADVAESISRLSDAASVRVQGALLPHAGYRSKLSALDATRPVLPDEAVLLDPSADPFPFTVEQLRRLAAGLEADPRRLVERSRHGLIRIHPRRSSLPGEAKP